MEKKYGTYAATTHVDVGAFLLVLNKTPGAIRI